MTTRAGLAGILTGLVATLILFYPLAVDWRPESKPWGWIAVAAIVTVAGSTLAARWSGSSHPIRCAALGGLAGGLASMLVFCWLGAATAALTGLSMTPGQPNVEPVAAIVRETGVTFLEAFLGGMGLGLLGGWLGSPRGNNQIEIFDKSDPQMALNAAITALPASVVAAALAAGVFSLLASSVGRLTGENSLASAITELPLAVSMLLVLVAHLALTLIVSHEAQQAEHLCGIDEVKMAAYVGIGAAPVLALLLFYANREVFSNHLVIVALLASAAMSLKSLHTLLKQVLPKRAIFAGHQDSQQRIQAKLFGTIAVSNGPRLVVLCIGCGLMMVLPLHVSVFSYLINLNDLLINPNLEHSTLAETAHKLFISQALVSTGLMVTAAAVLSTIYLFYLNLGRWFNRWNSQRPN